MATIGIEYVDKSGSGHEHITHLGSDKMRFTRDAVIGRLERDTDIFYVSEGGGVVLVKVVNDRVKGKYVRTVKDGIEKDNLLYLKPCPPGLFPVFK